MEMFPRFSFLRRIRFLGPLYGQMFEPSNSSKSQHLSTMHLGTQSSAPQFNMQPSKRVHEKAPATDMEHSKVLNLSFQGRRQNVRDKWTMECFDCSTALTVPYSPALRS